MKNEAYRNKRGPSIARVVWAGVLFMAIGSQAMGDTLYVDPAGKHIFPFKSPANAATNIQAAIDAAVAGDTVLVAGGIYNTGGRTAPGSSLTNRVVIDKPIIVESMNGPGVTVIQGAFHPGTTNGNAAIRCVWMTNGSTLIGFNLVGGATRSSGTVATERNGGGLWAQSTNAVVVDCWIENNAANFFGGGAFRGTLNGCFLGGNKAGAFGGGASDATLNYSILTDNMAIAGGGAYRCNINNSLLAGNTAIEGGGATEGTLINCTVVGNHATQVRGGVSGGTNLNSIVYFNTAVSNNPNHGASVMAYTCTTPLPTGTGNITNNPLFVNAAFGNYRLTSASPAINRGTNGFVVGAFDLDGNPRIDFGRVDMGAFEFQIASVGTTRFVNINTPAPAWPFATWATAATNIQHAIDTALPGHLVLVSNGVYQTGVRIAPNSEQFNRVFIDKPITVQSVHGASNTVIRGNPAEGPSGSLAVRCVWMTNGSTLIGFTLADGATRSNSASSLDLYGGGIFAQSTNVLIQNCRLVNNKAHNSGGGIYRGTLNHCDLSGNVAVEDGGGANSSRLNDCRLFENIAGNGGGAAYSVLNRCEVFNNAASFGGGALGGSLNNCLLVNNTASTGGGAFISTLRQCTVANNLANSSGGVFEGSVFNSIVYSNSAISSPNYDEFSFFQFSCTTPLPVGGSGNTTNLPAFVNAPAGNYRLAAGSPAINAGDNAQAVGDTDLDGNPRIRFVTVDMGAYEYQTPASSGATHFVVLNNPNAGFPYTNVFTAAPGIQQAIDAAVPGNTVIVHDGVYQTGGRTAPGSLLTNRVVIDKPIWVQSVNGSDFTVIRGARHPGTTNGNAAVRCVWMTNGATLVGFTLTNGATRATSDIDTERSGGGLWAQSQAAVVRDCLLNGNVASEDGGGARRGTMINCTLIGNSSRVLGGGARGSWMTNSILIGNVAGLSGGGASGGIMHNCLLTGNYAESRGGGAHSVQLHNCTIIDNTAGGSGGGVWLGFMFNCISYFNTAPTNSNHESVNSIQFSCTTPLPVFGSGNITNNPMFASIATGNFRLTAGSPCRDMGDNAFVFAPTGPDLDGNPRIVHAFVDMGAYEFQGSPPGDFDGDGLSNADERIAGSDPFNPDDTWRILAATHHSVSFNTLAGRVYAVDRNDNLVAAPQVWTEFTNNIPGTGGALIISDPDSATATNRNYRVRVGLAP